MSKIGIGNRVKITGPNIHGHRGMEGEIITITQEDKWTGPNRYSAPGFAWYPESSLELVPAFQKGQTVLIIGPTLIEKRMIDAGSEFEIAQVKSITDRFPEAYSEEGRPWYPASSLELVDEPKIKLSPEIKEKLRKAIVKAITEPCDFPSKFAAIDEKISQLEERDGIQQKQLLMQASAIRFLEAWQKDQPQGQSIKVLFEGQRSGKLAAMAEEIAVHSANRKEDVLSKIYAISAAGIDPREVLRSVQPHEAKEARKKRDADPVISQILDEEPIKVGDWAMVDDVSYEGTKASVGRIMRIEEIDANSAKLEGRWHALCSLRKLSDADTTYIEDGKEKQYPLPEKGNFMILLLQSVSGKGMLWTTVRSQKGRGGLDKMQYYRDHIGAICECQITK